MKKITNACQMRAKGHPEIFLRKSVDKRRERLYELSRQGFIAMSFDPSISNIEEAFKRAITVAGYKPQIIKDKEHNNYIMPEIFYEIKNSRFVVVDVTKPNYGAYYEAGYAQALLCCK